MSAPTQSPPIPQTVLNGTSGAIDDDDDWWDRIPERPVPESYYRESPLFMQTEDVNMENDTIQALQALLYDQDSTPDELAEKFKNNGNQVLEEHKKELKKYLPDALEWYNKGLEQRMKDMKLKCQLLANRAHVHILLGNYGKAVEDCKECITIDSKNVKAMYRMAKAANALNKWKLALQSCERALKIEPNNASVIAERDKADKALKKMHEQQIAKREQEKMEKEKPKKVAQLLNDRGIKVGKNEMESSQFEKLIKDMTPTGGTSLGGLVVEEESGELYFQVVIAYDQFSQTDFIQNFGEHETLYDRLSEMFPPHGQELPFGTEKERREYYLDNLRVFYYNQHRSSSLHNNYVEVKNLKSTLRQIMTQKEYLLPANFMPVFHIVAKTSPKQILEPLTS